MAESVEWRRGLSVLEETDGIVLSPFEKNTERSQVAVYIVDDRDPLAFFCADLVRSRKKQSLPVLLALNKADLVPASAF
jgi:large subunit GTPase 1